MALLSGVCPAALMGLLPADAVVVGIGAQPRVEFAAVCGDRARQRHRHRRIPCHLRPRHLCGRRCRDVWNPALGRRHRLEDWSAALKQGPLAARNMLGIRTAYDQVPFFFTDHYTVWMEFTGYATDEAEVHFRGDPTAGEAAEFIAFWLREEKLVAGMNVNIKGVPDIISALIRAGRPLDRGALSDPDVELASLLPPA